MNPATYNNNRASACLNSITLCGPTSFLISLRSAWLKGQRLTQSSSKDHQNPTTIRSLLQTIIMKSTKKPLSEHQPSQSQQLPLWTEMFRKKRCMTILLVNKLP